MPKYGVTSKFPINIFQILLAITVYDDNHDGKVDDDGDDDDDDDDDEQSSPIMTEV